MEETRTGYWLRVRRETNQRLAVLTNDLADQERVTGTMRAEVAELTATLGAAAAELARLGAPNAEPEAAADSSRVSQPSTASSATASSAPESSGRGSEDAPPFDPTRFVPASSSPATAGAPSAEAPQAPPRAVDIARSATQAQKLATGTLPQSISLSKPILPSKWEKVCTTCLGQPREEPCPACGSDSQAEEAPQAGAGHPDGGQLSGPGQELPAFSTVEEARKAALDLMVELGWPRPDTPKRVEGLKGELAGIVGREIASFKELDVADWGLIILRFNQMLEAGPSGKGVGRDPASAATG